MDAVRLGFRFHPTIAGRLAGLERAIQAALRGGILCPSARATTGRYMICFTTNLKQVDGVLRTVNPFTEREHRPP
jgi:hypothetical protein